MGAAWRASCRRLRHFYKYLLLDRYIASDPTLNIDTPRQWKVLPKSLAADEVEALLQGPPRAKDDRVVAGAYRPRPRDAGSVLRRGATRLRDHQPEARRPEAGAGIRAGARQRRQGAHRAAGPGGAGDGAAVSARCAPACWRQGSRRHFCLSRAGRRPSPGSGYGRW